MEYKDYDTSSVILARTIASIRTYFDLIDSIVKNQKVHNDFWDLIFENLYNSIILESFKLIDKKNLSLFSLIKEVKGTKTDKIEELDNDFKELSDFINDKDFKIIQHRHTQVAHHSRKSDYSLARFAELNQVLNLLTKCEELITKYNSWIKGDSYRIDFNSKYAGGHSHLLKYVSTIISN